MKKKDVRLKGQLRMYMQWPVIMTVLLAAMNIWMYMVDRKAGGMMSVMVIIYMVIVGVLYVYNRSLILADMVQFSTQYKAVQNTLLKELSIPYAILMEDGRIVWKNDRFAELFADRRREKYLNKLIPELNRGVYPKGDVDHVELEVHYNDRDYQAELRKVSVEGFSDTEEVLQIPKEKEYFIAVYLNDVTELNAYIKENEDQRLIAGLIYIDNYDEVMESVEEVRQSLLVALIDRKINKYIGDVDGIVKKLEKDKYFIVIRKESYRKFEADKFSLLEEVKQVNIGNARSASLSIGLGLNTATYAQSYNYARVAIDLALARGGDQAVVKDCQLSENFLTARHIQDIILDLKCQSDFFRNPFHTCRLCFVRSGKYRADHHRAFNQCARFQFVNKQQFFTGDRFSRRFDVHDLTADHSVDPGFLRKDLHCFSDSQKVRIFQIERL